MTIERVPREKNFTEPVIPPNGNSAMTLSVRGTEVLFFPGMLRMCLHILSECDTEIGVGIELLVGEHLSGVHERHLRGLGH